MWCLYYLIFSSTFILVLSSLDGVIFCQQNCVSSDRLTGPTRMPETRDHPWKVAEYPTRTAGFCKLGCQLFYTELPVNSTCKRICDYYYRYQVTVGYSDIATEAQLECRDGCEIGLQICQAGYYCNSGRMLPCPAGSYREAVTSVSIDALNKAQSCTPCPYGRYRSIEMGKTADECSLCPIGKYANVTGSVKVSDCQRCPAGKTAENEGMQLCKCITKDSCDMELSDPDGHSRDVYYKNKIDYYRESVPFIGRW